MRAQLQRGYWIWLVAGLAIGWELSQWQQKPPLQAASTDSEDRLGLCTVQTTPGGVGGMPEAVFVLDYATGRMTGSVLNQQSGKFSVAFSRDIAKDFGVNPTAKPKYLMVAGELNPVAGGGAQYASGAIYVAEISTGKCAAYTIPLPNMAGAATILQPADVFSFRERTGK